MKGIWKNYQPSLAQAVHEMNQKGRTGLNQTVSRRLISRGPNGQETAIANEEKSQVPCNPVEGPC